MKEKIKQFCAYNPVFAFLKIYLDILIQLDMTVQASNHNSQETEVDANLGLYSEF